MVYPAIKIVTAKPISVIISITSMALPSFRETHSEGVLSPNRVVNKARFFLITSYLGTFSIASTSNIR
jgi:hypothetical protein